jgi:hypothetical protein
LLVATFLLDAVLVLDDFADLVVATGVLCCPLSCLN